MRTQDDLEIDLVVERPGKPLLFIEIKSADQIREDHLKQLMHFKNELGKKVEAICLANVSEVLKYDSIFVYPWAEGISR